MTIRFDGAALALVAAFACSSRTATADVTKLQCVNANGNGQSLRRAGKLAEAREQFKICTDPKCPGLVVADCTKRLDDLESAQPTIIFDVKDGSGHDLSAVTVTVDGHPLASTLDGTPLSIDPGEHAFAFTATDQAPVTQTFVLREGEQGRHERIVIGSPPPPPIAASTPATAAESAPEARTSDGRTQKILGVTATAVGLAGIAVGTVFGLETASEANKQKTDCPTETNCLHRAQAASEHSSGATDATISTVAFIAGGAFVATGVVLFLTAIHREPQLPTVGFTLTPIAGPDGAGLLLRGGF
jgi:hypothetical protein